MSLVDWLADVPSNLRRGREGVHELAYEFYIGGLRRAGGFVGNGDNVYDQDWDVLILLDACRVDALQYVTDEYDWLSDPGSRRSVAGRSDDWMDRTFNTGEEDVASTIYVTGNPFADDCLSENQFRDLVRVYRSGWDESIDAMPARPITDHAVRAGREFDLSESRMVVHYMQPHFPSIPAVRGDESMQSFGRGGLWTRYQQVRSGEISIFDVVESYLANLRYVLEEVALLKENLEVDTVVVSADHGTALGEAGVYGHSGLPLSCVRRVPWAEISATDTGSYTPEIDSVRPDETQVEEQLSALGYR